MSETPDQLEPRGHALVILRRAEAAIEKMLAQMGDTERAHVGGVVTQDELRSDQAHLRVAIGLGELQDPWLYLGDVPS